MATPEEIAWLAGLYEGEGTFSAAVQRRSHTSGKDRVILRFCIAMTDEDVVRRANSLFPGYGNVRFQQPAVAERKTVYYWTVGSMPQMVDLLIQLWQWLSPRRRKQVIDAFAKYEVNAVERGVPFSNPFPALTLALPVQR